MDLLKHYEHNIAIFSGAKTFQQVKDMSSLVFTENGYKRDYSEFKKLITGDKFHEGVFAKYNKNYLKTEYNTALSTAQMGREWLQIEDDADVFPYLKYVTAHDERVRHTHQLWDGVVRPVGDAFWTTHVPPNGFNCRCRLMQLNPDDDVFSVTPDDVIKTMPKTDSPLFQMNPAKSGYIFDPSIHPYTKNVEERFKVSASQNFGFPTPPKPAPLKPTPKIVVPEAKIVPEFPIRNIEKFTKETIDPEFLRLIPQDVPIYKAKAGECSAYTPWNESVRMRFNGYPTPRGQRRIIYHEYGHAIHFLRGWNNFQTFDPIVENYYNKIGKLSIIDELKVNKKFSKDLKGGMSREAWAEHDRLRDVYSHVNDDDFQSMFVEIADTFGALTDEVIGLGHGESYYLNSLNFNNKKVFQYCEFLAHSFENRFVGNEIFKTEYPDIYDLMVEMINELIKTTK